MVLLYELPTKTSREGDNISVKIRGERKLNPLNMELFITPKTAVT